ncbi:MAG: putative porin, partial [Paramuribaculum sp.]|nr:putative porin [Paramuribaculum sp.]
LVDGNVSTRFGFLGDSLNITAYGRFSNEEAPYLMKQFVSNHFIWKNDFGKTRRLRLGGVLNIGRFGTYINAGVENIQNLIYFGQNSMPQQNGGSVQVVSASLSQNFRVGILHWNNKLNFQTSSNDAVLPLPKFSVYSNLFILFKVAKVMDVQFGIDCNYYTRYYAPDYQPATTTFYNQREMKCGNYPFMNAYANMKLSKARFYVMFSHVNQGLTGNNYFSMPHYPMNPRRFQLGVSVDFAN